METVRDSSSNLQLLSELLLSGPFSTQPAAARGAVSGSAEIDSPRIGELVSALDQKGLENLKSLEEPLFYGSAGLRVEATERARVDRELSDNVGDSGARGIVE